MILTSQTSSRRLVVPIREVGRGVRSFFRRLAMLILSRKVGEDLILGGVVRVRVLAVKGQRVKIAIEAPREVKVLRGELSLAKPLAEKKSERGA
jgi:carbon storage regulator CsrA